MPLHLTHIPSGTALPTINPAWAEGYPYIVNGVLYLLQDGAFAPALAGGDGSGGGLPGLPGADGREVELRQSVSAIQWRHVGDDTWTDLVPLSAITGAKGDKGDAGGAGAAGADGRQVELRKTDTHVQWRYVGDTTWLDLIALTDVTGPAGPAGPPGPPGGDSTGGGGGTYTRTTTTRTTGPLQPNTREAGTIAMTAGYRIYRLVTNRPARVRLYVTAAQRDADLTRAPGVVPIGNHGLLADLVTTASQLTLDTAPLIDGWDGKATPDGLIPITIDNLDSVTGSVIATLTYLRTE